MAHVHLQVLAELNRPYICAVPLVFQSFEEWKASELGLHPIQASPAPQTLSLHPSTLQHSELWGAPHPDPNHKTLNPKTYTSNTEHQTTKPIQTDLQLSPNRSTRNSNPSPRILHPTRPAAPSPDP